MTYSATVAVMLKDGIADVQGQTVERSLPALGYTGVGKVRVGKRIELDVEADSREEARKLVEEMCERLLA
ncbi:MAG TPA: phosphoribosylformylglycinamidine synthase subunit PurS, partial [Actinomycetota bacterium]|nr:phosphoribosylformylglycinamidine synthase subunit PurS [Actinomycetota bacterium]